MAARPLILRRRLFCTTSRRRPGWTVKQVTKSNFKDSAEEIKTHISNSDFIAVALQKTGSSTSIWQRASVFDTAETAYFKAKYAAERFQVFQFAVCPFTIRDSKLIAYPYNFHLFPREELKPGMPSYSFSCQPSSLISMARAGFDFNACVSDGISYLSRDQELAANRIIKSPRLCKPVTRSSSTPSIADAIFMERIKSRVKNWKKTYSKNSLGADVVLLTSLRNLILQSDKFGSRPSITIDVCSEYQVQLVLETLSDISDDLVPMTIPAKSGGTQAVCVVLTSSKEDKDLLMGEFQNIEEEDNKRVRGFRDVIDMISSSQKPVVSSSSLNDFTSVHSSFLAPLPPNIEEFTRSLQSAFPRVLDVNHLMKKVGVFRKETNIPGAIAYLNNRYSAPISVEVPHEEQINEEKNLGLNEEKSLGHDVIDPRNKENNLGHNVISISHLFAKLCSIMKIASDPNQPDKYLISSLEDYANIFSPCSSTPRERVHGDIRVSEFDSRKVSCENLVFLWGFRGRMTAKTLKTLLQEYVVDSEFELRLVDRSCAIVVFLEPGLSRKFLDAMNSNEIGGSLKKMVSEGVRAAGFDTYKRVCGLGMWELELADSLDKATADPQCHEQEIRGSMMTDEVCALTS